MSKRAEQAAYNYAKENGTLGYDYNQIYDAAKNGYEQAEKVLIPLINRLCEAILFDWEDKADLAWKIQSQIKEEIK